MSGAVEVSDGPTTCPNCGGDMVEDTHTRMINISLSGPEGGDEMEVDADDTIKWVCENCSWTETTEQRGEVDDGDDEEEDEGDQEG